MVLVIVYIKSPHLTKIMYGMLKRKGFRLSQSHDLAIRSGVGRAVSLRYVLFRELCLEHNEK